MAKIDFRPLITRLVMSLPAPILRRMSGGAAVEAGGRTLDPQTQVMAYAARRAPKLTGFPPAVARFGAAQSFKAAGGPLERGVTVEDFHIPASHGEVPARVYRPNDQDPSAPVFVYLHMGGGVVGDLETGHAFCSILAKTVRGPVVSVDYRLAPEHPFPAGLDDSLHAYRWARDNAARFGAPAGRAAVGGDSMGGNFAAVICQDLKAAGEAQPAVQLLIYPATDMASETPSMATHADAFPLTAETMDWFMGHYLPAGTDPGHLRLSPMKAADLRGLAPAIVITAGFDPLSDQGELYARKLKAAGVPTLYRGYDSLSHAFIGFTGLVKAADRAAREIAGMVRRGYDGQLGERPPAP